MLQRRIVASELKRRLKQREKDAKKAEKVRYYLTSWIRYSYPSDASLPKSDLSAASQRPLGLLSAAGGVNESLHASKNNQRALRELTSGM